MKKMNYEERLRKYEEEKRLLQNKNLNYLEYQKEIQKLADKWRI